MAEVRAEAPGAEKAPTREQQPRQAANTGRRAVRFALRSPNAKSVAVAGSFNGWQPSTRLSQRDGQWMCEIELDPGSYEYRFVVDGQWMEDPACSAHATNPYGGRNSVVKV